MKIRFAATALAFLLIACNGDDAAGPFDDEGSGADDPGTPSIAEVSVESPVVMLWDVGQSTTLTAHATDAQGEPVSGAVFEWSSADPSVATVVDGVVTAVGDGWTETMATAQGKTGGVSIVVVTPDGPTDRTDCMACHAAEYTEQHGGTSTPETCLQCHSGPTWTQGDFDHPAVSNGFELLGAHALISCAACHQADGSPRYPGVADDECIACHQSDYDGQHGGTGTPTACLQCHTRDAWGGSSFDHPAVANGFELSGPHASLSCTACHGADGTPLYPSVADDECIACHQSDYDAEHSGSGYPTTCLDCHDGNTWTGADFDHDAQYFPIQTGRHAGRWGGCSTCHTNSADYSEFTCFACHVHDQGRMDDKHSGISGYAYDSTLCYSCHPQGEA